MSDEQDKELKLQSTKIESLQDLIISAMEKEIALLREKADKFDECIQLLGTKDDDRFYESSTFANLRFTIARYKPKEGGV